MQSEVAQVQFIKAIRKFMEMRTLTIQILRESIDYIDECEAAGNACEMADEDGKDYDPVEEV